MAVNPVSHRQEAFCVEYLRNGGNASRAYEVTLAKPGANPANFKDHGAKLLRQVNVMNRLRELQEMVAEKAGVTAADIVRQLDEDRDFARTSGQASAMVKATEAKARLLGLDKNETNLTIRPDDARQIITQFLAKYANASPALPAPNGARQ